MAVGYPAAGFLVTRWDEPPSTVCDAYSREWGNCD